MLRISLKVILSIIIVFRSHDHLIQRVVLKLVHPDLGISRKAMCIVESFLNDIFDVSKREEHGEEHRRRYWRERRNVRVSFFSIFPYLFFFFLFKKSVLRLRLVGSRDTTCETQSRRERYRRQCGLFCRVLHLLCFCLCLFALSILSSSSFISLSSLAYIDRWSREQAHRDRDRSSRKRKGGKRNKRERERRRKRRSTRKRDTRDT